MENSLYLLCHFILHTFRQRIKFHCKLISWQQKAKNWFNKSIKLLLVLLLTHTTTHTHIHIQLTRTLCSPAIWDALQHFVAYFQAAQRIFCPQFACKMHFINELCKTIKLYALHNTTRRYTLTHTYNTLRGLRKRNACVRAKNHCLLLGCRFKTFCCNRARDGGI